MLPKIGPEKILRKFKIILSKIGPEKLLIGSGELAHGSTPNLVLRSFYPTNSSDFHQRSLELSQNSSRTRLNDMRTIRDLEKRFC